MIQSELQLRRLKLYRYKMTSYQQYGHMRGYVAGENGFQFPQTTTAVSPTKQAAFSFRKRFERIDWKRLGKFHLSDFYTSLCLSFNYKLKFLLSSDCWLRLWPKPLALD